MAILRRIAVIVVGLVIVQAAVSEPEPPKDAPEYAVQFPTDPKVSQQLETARELAGNKEWEKACQVLQGVLDRSEDVFVRGSRTDEGGKPVKMWVSARQEAHHILAAMPAAGREEYQRAFGKQAQELLDRGQEKKDLAVIAEAAQRYFHTEAGLEATRLLAVGLVDDNQAVAASLWFDRLFERQPPEKQSEEVLFHAARAYRRSGLSKEFDKVWGLLEKKVGDRELRIGDRSQVLKKWKEDLDSAVAKAQPANKEGWPMFRGTPSRNGTGTGGPPVLQRRWRLENREGPADKVLQEAVTATEQPGGVVLPGAVPLVADDKVIYRSIDGLWVITKEGKISWNTTGEARWSLERITWEGAKWESVKRWIVDFSQHGRPNILLENSTIGVLSTDGVRVYAVDDLPMPPPPMTNGVFPRIYGALHEAIRGSRLQAYDLKSGKLVWELGGKGAPGPDLTETHFLGAPLPLRNTLFVLAERKGDLLLLGIDPQKGGLNWTQRLGTVAFPILDDPVRRTQAANLASADGILVVPTNAGALFGVDLLTHSILWMTPYRPPQPRGPDDPALPPGVPPRGKPLPRGTNEWKLSAPVISEGRVVFTAFDTASLHCVNLRDGRLLWQAAKKEDDLYLAGVFGDKVLVVGRKECRALALKDGSAVWSATTGTPSGLGAAVAGVYYLPLKAAADGKEPEVCALDIARGQIISHIRGEKPEPLGNLIFVEGLMISQSLGRITAYPRLDEKPKDKEDR